MFVLNLLFFASEVDGISGITLNWYTIMVSLGFMGGISALYYELKIRMTKMEDRNLHLEKQIDNLLHTVQSMNHKLDLLTEDHAKLEAWKQWKESEK